MPRYKDSPEVRAAKQERKDKLREFLSLLEVDDMHDLRSLFKAIPHKDCVVDVPTDFSSDCIETTQEYWRIARSFCVI